MFACRAGGGDGQDREADEVTGRLVGPRPARTVRSGAGMQIVVANLKSDESVGAWLVDPRVLGSRCLSFLFRWVWGRALSLCLVMNDLDKPAISETPAEWARCLRPAGVPPRRTAATWSAVTFSLFSVIGNKKKRKRGLAGAAISLPKSCSFLAGLLPVQIALN